tara:strand:+ start:976 stop:1635 length:660 start_codon:yes stop_codon:yes gene_type:complete
MIRRIPRFEALIIILFISPFLIIISAIIFIKYGRPVLFLQDRIGKDYKVFKIIKFRSMVVNKNQNLITKKGDSRVTSFGKFIRKYKIDELPQLWNIFKNEMAFIGPRPEVPEYFNKKDFSFLKEIKPGLSDFSSIIFRNEEEILANIEGNISYNDLLKVKLRLSLLYSKYKSIPLDFVLIILTLISILSASYASNILDKYIISYLDRSLSNDLKGWINK